MKKFASKQGSQLILKDDGGYTFKMSKDEWQRIGKQAGWMKQGGNFGLSKDIDSETFHTIKPLVSAASREIYDGEDFSIAVDRAVNQSGLGNDPYIRPAVVAVLNREGLFPDPNWDPSKKKPKAEPESVFGPMDPIGDIEWDS